MYHRARAGKYADIFRDPAIMIKDGAIGSLQKLASIPLDLIPFLRNDANSLRERAHLREIRTKLKRYRQLSQIGKTYTKSNEMGKIVDEIEDMLK
jgi:hypothetical protein